MNNESHHTDTVLKHCGKKLISSSFLYEYQGITLLWKGHLYNRTLDQKTSVIDPICVIRYYLKNGIYKTLRKINGDFSFVLFDPRLTDEESVLYVAMDIFGMFPLYTHTRGNEIHITEKEKKGVLNRRFLPSCYSKYFLSHRVHEIWKLEQANTPYYIPPIPMPPLENPPTSEVHHICVKNTLLMNVQRRIEAYGITGENAIMIMLLDEKTVPLFEIVLDIVKDCGFTPLFCSNDDPLLHEESEYSPIFILSVSKRIHEQSFHEKHVVLYPCVDVLSLQLHILLGLYF